MSLFGSKISPAEYKKKYVASIDKFFNEAKENGGVWIPFTEPIEKESTSWSFQVIQGAGPFMGYINLWSSPADALSLSIHLEEKTFEMQSMPFELLASSLLSSGMNNVGVSLNPRIRNSKEGVVVDPVHLLPLELAFKAYTGSLSIEDATELDTWIQKNRDEFGFTL